MWPTSVRAVIPFPPEPNNTPEFVVDYLDYAIFAVIQITSIARVTFPLNSLVVNGEFRPVFAVGETSDQLVPLCLPIRMDYGQSFGAILRAPFSKISASGCYPKLPASLVISTGHGDFRFTAGKASLICDSSDGTNRNRRNAYASRQTFPKHTPGSMECETDLRMVQQSHP